MRSIVRSAVTAGLFAVLALVAGSASFAPSVSAAETGRYSLDDAWCFDDGLDHYCTEIDGWFRYTVTPDGRERVTINSRQHIVVTRDGVLIGESTKVTADRTIYLDGGLFSLHSNVHTKVDYIDQECVSGIVLRMTNYGEVVDFRFTGPECA